MNVKFSILQKEYACFYAAEIDFQRSNEHRQIGTSSIRTFREQRKSTTFQRHFQPSICNYNEFQLHYVAKIQCVNSLYGFQLELIWVRPYTSFTPYIQKHLQIPYMLTTLQNHLLWPDCWKNLFHHQFTLFFPYLKILQVFFKHRGNFSFNTGLIKVM